MSKELRKRKQGRGERWKRLIWKIFLLFLIKIPGLSDGNWWYLGLSSSQYQDPATADTTSTRVPPYPKDVCSDVEVFDAHQKQMCSKTRNVVGIVSRGAANAIDECQFQFRNRRWNCTTFQDQQKSVFGNVLSVNGREKAYIYAILSAGVAYTVSKACAKGELRSCSCDPTVRSRPTDGSFIWGGCSHDVSFAEKFSREFVDRREDNDDDEDDDDDERQLMNRWNNEAGRKAVSGNMRLLCKCHGVSGSCSAKICWRTVSAFREVGDHLKDKFDGATLVKVIPRLRSRSRSRSRSKVRPVDRKQKRPTRRDLVYLQQSPDYCDFRPEVGSVGTSGRQCNRTGYGLDSCQLLCCGRGYRTYLEQVTEDCNCRFFWCCRVDCQNCVTQVEKYYCN